LWYRRLRLGALLMLFILLISLSYAIRQTPQSVMMVNDAYVTIGTLAKSVSSINSIEYKQNIKTIAFGDKSEIIEMHYYYKKPNYLRIETKCSDNVNIDIYNPAGMYEYFPISSMAYFREKWKDEKPLPFQLEDKLQDITISGRYEMFKIDNLGNLKCEILRSVDDDYDGRTFEHRIWLSTIDGLNLPVKEEYLTDGEVDSISEYEYMSINKGIDDSIFQLKSSSTLKIYDAPGIPKIVKDENEAEKYVKFNVSIPQYVPKNFTLNEIFIIPPAKTPTVLVSYISDTDTIYFSQKNIRKNELITSEVDKTINAGGKKFAIRKLFNESLSVRWVKTGIEFEVSGTYTLKDEMIKLVQSVSGVFISIE